MQLLQKNRCFEGEQRIYQFESSYLKGPAKFGVYLPPAALEGKACSTLFY
ncbi:S-formylglutathione hydrolase, partial [Acinetobacter baumannii]